MGDLFDVVARHGLHFDQSRQSGIVFHMISSITEHGRVGMTAVGDSAEHAMELYERSRKVLLDEARIAGRIQRTLPPTGGGVHAPRRLPRGTPSRVGSLTPGR